MEPEEGLSDPFRRSGKVPRSPQRTMSLPERLAADPETESSDGDARDSKKRKEVSPPVAVSNEEHLEPQMELKMMAVPVATCSRSRTLEIIRQSWTS